MQRIGLVLKRSENEAIALGEAIVRFVKEQGKELLLEPSCADLAEAWDVWCSPCISDEADLLVVLGGDGTILRAATLLNDKPTPVLGVNLGRVGFMAEVSPSEAIDALGKALRDEAATTHCMMLQITLSDGRRIRVLNDAVIHWSGIARIIDLGIRLPNSREIELRADGLIISTPIGSSAYSYAAYGPLIHPEMEAILLTPICPYAGLKRPLLLPPHMETEIALKKGEHLMLTLDGHTTTRVEQGTSIRVIRSPLPFVMIKSGTHDYCDVLREKLHLL
jgi:NAD+ kinase